MDKQLEERIRERAYELWMQHGCLPGRADDYWYQAEQEILGEADTQAASDVGASDIGASDVGGGTAADVGSFPAGEGQEQTQGDVGPAASGAAAEPSGEAAPAKTRRRRGTAAETPAEGADAAGAAPKRRRTTRTS